MNQQAKSVVCNQTPTTLPDGSKGVQSTTTSVYVDEGELDAAMSNAFHEIRECLSAAIEKHADALRFGSGTSVIFSAVPTPNGRYSLHGAMSMINAPTVTLNGHGVYALKPSDLNEIFGAYSDIVTKGYTESFLSGEYDDEKNGVVSALVVLAVDAEKNGKSQWKDALDKCSKIMSESYALIESLEGGVSEAQKEEIVADAIKQMDEILTASGVPASCSPGRGG